MTYYCAVKCFKKLHKNAHVVLSFFFSELFSDIYCQEGKSLQKDRIRMQSVGKIIGICS